MPVKINNIESDIRVTEGEPAGRLSAEEVERVVRLVMERMEEERRFRERINEETRITNGVSVKDLFD